MISKALSFVLALICVACNLACRNDRVAMAPSGEDPSQSIVDSAIAAMGGEILDHAEIRFRFRLRDYVYYNVNGSYAYTRIYVDTSGTVIEDVLTNEGLTRTNDGDTITLDSTWTSRYSNSVNSVMYFAFLPCRLNDPAVIKTYNGVVSIKGRDYHEVLIQFQEEGGGKVTMTISSIGSIPLLMLSTTSLMTISVMGVAYAFAKHSTDADLTA